ncbi:MAG: GBS Bsp-like repeat-containing protein [Lachnospiraceae bacterium]|nr:GBS Bsp-like repeat-containing protein [Lachnospiraceae bacterium]
MKQKYLHRYFAGLLSACVIAGTTPVYAEAPDSSSDLEETTLQTLPETDSTEQTDSTDHTNSTDRTDSTNQSDSMGENAPADEKTPTEGNGSGQEDIVTEESISTEGLPSEAPEKAAPEEHTDVTIDEQGVVTLTAEGYDIPADVKEQSVAVWSRENAQDDIRWYKLEKTDTGLTVKVDLKNHGAKDDLYYFHLYYKTADNKMVCFSTKNYEVSGVFKTRMEATENANGFRISLTNPTVAPKKVEFAIWSAQNSQDDIRWYTASYDAQKKSAVFNWDLSNLKHFGDVHVHCYATDAAGKKVFQGSLILKVESKRPEIGSVNAVFTPDTGKYKVTLSGIKNADLIQKILVPTWSDSKQADIIWHEARKNADGTYTVDSQISAHGNRTGTYNVHVYVTDKSGVQFMAGKTTFTVEAPSIRTNTEAVITGTSCELRAINYPELNSAKNIRVAFWSKDKGQDDIRWYPLSRKTEVNGSKSDTVWYAKIDLKNHGAKNDTYYAHVYYDNATGKPVCISPYSFTVNDLFKTSVNATQTSTGYKIVLSNPTIDPKAVRFAIWSKENGQDDIKWYNASYDSKKREAVYNWTLDNLKHKGDVYIHCYATASDGSKVFQGSANVTVGDLPKINAGKAAVRTVKQDHSYQVAVTELDANTVKSVSVAVWSAAGGQDDLVWYPASRNGSEYLASIPIQKHKTAGHYYVHVYVTKTDGKQYTDPDLQTGFDVSSDLVCEYAYTDRQTDNGTFVIHMNEYGYTAPKTVSFNVWTEANGQDDLEVLPAVKQADGSWAAIVNPARHGYEAGIYRISSNLSLESGQTCTGNESSYNVSEETVLYTIVASEESATAILQGHADASDVSFKVWSVNGGQDDLKNYPAVSRGDSWTYEILKKNHGNAGQYKVEAYVDGNLVATDLFSFDENRLADSWYSISTAHGGGGQGAGKNDIYTNCLSAMNNSYQQGYRTFEIDVLLTKDNQPVLYHTWKTDILDKYRYSSATSAGPSYAEFMNDTMYGGKYKTSDFKTLLTYLKQHPDVKILLDTKYRSVAEIKNLYTILLQTASSMGAVSNLQNQIIPYFFATDQLSAIRSVCTFKEYHFATYAAYRWQTGSFPLEDFRSLIQFCKMNNVLSISLWDSLVTADMIRVADSYGITVYVHTTDDPATAERLLQMGAAGIVSNKITPVQAVGFIQ